MNTTKNIADCASRGQRVEAFMKNDTWISGPDLAREGCEEITSDDPEVKRVMVNFLKAGEDTNVVS